MWPEKFNIPVSRETQERLGTYHALLLKWQKAINLVSPKTLDQAWVRHFADSAQLLPYLSETDVAAEEDPRLRGDAKCLVDLGSGAGFPGLVLAIMNPGLDVHLVESDERKCQFLRTVSRETGVNITVHNQRIEALTDAVKPDVVTARALADLSTLLAFAQPWAAANPGLECLFMKGAKAPEEIEDARGRFDFSLDEYVSVTDPAARILHLRNIAAKSGE